MTEIEKSQIVRAIDVLFIGPFLIYVGLQRKNSELEDMLLIGLGALTIVYNGRNYLLNIKK